MRYLRIDFQVSKKYKFLIYNNLNFYTKTWPDFLEKQPVFGKARECL